MKIHIGIIESDFDESNSTHTLWSNKSEIKGWGKRYKVRIPGIHSENKSIIPSIDLPIAEVIYPVTAGTGHEACYQTDSLKQGSTVILWEDDNKRFFIIGCKGNNEQTNLFRGEPPFGFVPYSLTFSGPSFNFSTFDNKFFESTSNIATLNNWANFYELSDGKRTSPLSSSSICDNFPLGQVQVIIQNFIKDVNEAKVWLSKQKQTLQQPIRVGLSTGEILNKTIDNQQLFQNTQKPVVQTYSIDQWLENKIQNYSKEISKFLKDITNRIETGVTNLINDSLNNIYYTLFPNQQQELKEKVETVNDLIACLFRKIVRNLLKMIAAFLKSAANFITTPASCIIENFVGGLFGKILGLISKGIDKILQPISAVLGVFDISSDILNVVEDVLSTLSCDENPSCPKIQEWSLWDGPESVFISTTNFSNIFSKIKSFANNLQQNIDLDNFDFDLDFSDVFQDNCNIGALACGPPIVEFIGGGGSGASGNAIVNSLGQIIGVDITSSGNNFTSSPIVKFSDACGNGSGAIGRAVLGPVNSNVSNNGVINVIIEDSGEGYLSIADGSYGSTGVTITDKIIKKPIEYPIGSNGSYPVIMKLCEIIIEDGGFGYSQDDTISIVPNNGAIAKPYFTSNGSLYKIDMLNKGEGFKELPVISINTKTGYNAILIPRLCAEQIGDIIVSATLDKIINVIDCPGR